MMTRRHPHRSLIASLSVFVWLAVSVFSCASLASSSIPDSGHEGTSQTGLTEHAGHNMGAMSAAAMDMPCCEQVQTDCCPSPAHLAQPLAQLQPEVALPVTLALTQVAPRRHGVPGSGKSCPRQFRDGYPRLHLTHCTLLD